MYSEREADRQAGRQTDSRYVEVKGWLLGASFPLSFWILETELRFGTVICWTISAAPLWNFCLTVVKDMFYDALWLSVESQDFVSFSSVWRFWCGTYQVCRPEKTRPLFQSLKFSDMDGSKWKQDCLEIWVTLQAKVPHVLVQLAFCCEGVCSPCSG